MIACILSIFASIAAKVIHLFFNSVYCLGNRYLITLQNYHFHQDYRMPDNTDAF